MIDRRKLYEVRQELSREHGQLVASVDRYEKSTEDLVTENPSEVELFRLGLIQQALRALELVLQNYAQTSDPAIEVHPEERRDLQVFLYPKPEEVNVVLVDEAILLKAEDLMTGCEACNPAAELTFDYLLDALTACDSTTTEYLLRRPAKCRRCSGQVTEKTLVFYA